MKSDDNNTTNHETDEKYRLRKELEDEFKSQLSDLHKKIESGNEYRLLNEFQLQIDSKIKNTIEKSTKTRDSKNKAIMLFFTAAIGVFGFASWKEIPKAASKAVNNATSLEVIQRIQAKGIELDSVYTRSINISKQLESKYKDAESTQMQIINTVFEKLRLDNEFIKRTAGEKGSKGDQGDKGKVGLSGLPGVKGDNGIPFTPTVSPEYKVLVTKADSKKEVKLISSKNSVCFLTLVSFADIDGAKEKGTCEITSHNNMWHLSADLGIVTKANGSCSAKCLAW